MKKHARLSFYLNVHDLIDLYSTSDSKSYWRLLRRLTKACNSSDTIPPLIDPISGETLSDDHTKAELLNSYFCSISDLDDTNHEIPIIDKRTDSTFSTLNLTQDEIVDILKILKLGKAVGHDNISHHILKFTARSISKPLCILFNMSLQQSKFPNQWKLANVLPLFKKGNRDQASNYRPISLLSCVGKVFERVIFKHMYNYLHGNSLFYRFQSGFLPGHSHYSPTH